MVATVNVDWSGDCFGWFLAQLINQYLRGSSLIPDEILDDWMADLEVQQAKGHSFFTLGCHKSHVSKQKS
jgi:hypothetical protein